MGGKHSRLQREQKHQQRKQKKEKKGSKREEVAGSEGELSDKGQLVVTAEHLVQSVSVGGKVVTVRDSPSVPGNGDVVDVSFESALNITERDIERVGRAECSTAVRTDEEDNAKSSVTITICMLKMEPNAGTGAEDITATVDTTATVAGEDGGVAPAEADVMADNILSPRQCACFENGNFGSTAEEHISCTECSSNANATGSIDNRLNNNEAPNLSTPTTTSSTPAVASTVAPASSMSSNLATISSPSAVPATPAVSFMIGGHDPATISHLLHRLRHLHHHHHHLHHHHHHHLMHLHHLHHHHLPVTGGIADLPPDVTPSNTIDWRQQHTPHQWIPAGMVGSSNGAIARPADIPSGGSASMVGPALAANANPLCMDIDIDLKDKLEGLRLGPAATAAVGQRSSNNNVTEESGEHPYSVGECPTCCAMAMAANASGTLGGLLNGGAPSSVANGTSIYNGNAGEVEEKILNTSNQPSVTGGEKVSEQTAPVSAVTSLAVDNSLSGDGVSHSTDQISTEPNNTEAGSSSVATSSAVGTTAPIAGKDAVRTVALEDNSSKPTTVEVAAATPTSAPSMGLANATSDSPPATTVTAGSVVSPSFTAGSKTTGSTAAPSSSPTVATSCCNRKSSSSAASTLFGSLSFAGRRSRSSNARTGSCCANNSGPTCEGTSTVAATSPEQQQRSRISWIPGSGQKQQRNSNSGGSKNGRTDTATNITSPGSAKPKKSNWPFSLKSSSGSSQSRTSTGTSATGGQKQTTKASTIAAIGATGTTSSSCASTSTAMSTDVSNSIVSSVVAGGSSLRGSSLITSAKLLKGETDKDDSCVCTAYRKVSESPPPPSSPVPSAVTAGPSRVASPRPAESVEWFEEAIQGSALLPLNLHMLSSLRSGNASTSAAQSLAGVSAPMISLSPEPIPASMLSNHHHHHHHAMTAAALVADHHPAFFFSTTSGGANHHAHHGSVGAGGTAAAGQLFGTLPLGTNHSSANDVILLSDSPVLFDLTSDDFSVEDCDERARIQRELEIREGVDAPPNFHPRRLMSGGTIASGPAANHPIAFIYSRDLMQRGLLVANKLIQPLDAAGGCAAGRAGFGRLRIHSQVDFIHCLVPDLQKITSCSFYWGKMDRYEAERLLEGKPEGTFLLRDSAQEEFLFSVSFRKYNRSLHARIEQFNHKFSFDSRDPGVFTASTVTGLLEHYKDPSCVMFFEPMLTFPLNRNFSFSLQQLCRAVIVSNTTYDGINELTLPKSLKSYLKEYHYRQRVRFRPMDEHLYSNA
uniref:Suppressor of cytokine signaling 5 n=1 Tax=Anopheles minimus TaxID=112268 RepID=A0A182WDU8_9DIPT